MANTTYHRTTAAQRRTMGVWPVDQLRQHQLQRLNELLGRILPDNRFYHQKFAGSTPPPLASLTEISGLPMTTKHELVEQGESGFAANLTFPPDTYSRFHRTSGTQGQPMIVLDTHDDWNWWMEAWQFVLDSADLLPTDRVLMAFSFGPFIGFWSAFDAAVERGAMVIPTGAMSSVARLELIRSVQATVVFCTPSYALHLAEIADNEQFRLASTEVSRLIVAGEPGGSIPAIRDSIETAWQANVIDHCGASEVGPWGFADRAGRGIHVNESEFLPEFLPLDGPLTEACLRPVEGSPVDQLYELVLTCLGRVGSPVIRYRTGDLVRPVWPDSGDCRFVLLEGGVLGRTDDMMIIRGVNVFPTSIEQILRSFPEIQEYRMTAYKQGSLDQLKIEIEDQAENPQRVEQELLVRLGFRVDVIHVPADSLPRFEAKGKRFIDQR